MSGRAEDNCQWNRKKTMIHRQVIAWLQLQPQFHLG